MNQAIPVPDGLFGREFDGRPLYSHTVVTTGTKFVYVSGQLARSSGGAVVGRGDMRAQIQQVCQNLMLALEAAGASLADVVQTTTFTTDIDEFFKHSDVRTDCFRTGLPTSTTVEVSRLSSPEFLIEMNAVACIS